MSADIKKNKNIDSIKPEPNLKLIWESYDDFVRHLNLSKPIEKLTMREKFLKFFNKISVVFIGALITTIAFFFLIDPNELYNGGLNGLLQVLSKLSVGYGKIKWKEYHLLYYGLGFSITSLFAFLL
jgi:hypothetical protein